MKTIYFIIIGFALVISVSAQTNLIYGYVSDYGLQPVQSTVTLTLVSPNPRAQNGVWVRQDPITFNTDVNGYFYRSNVVWGSYEWDLSGSSGAALQTWVGINTTGSVNVITLSTNVFVIPNPAGPSYQLTNGPFALWNTSTNLASARAATVLWIYGTIPPYNSTNLPPHSLIFTN